MNRKIKFRYFDGYIENMVYSDDFPSTCPDGSLSDHQKLVHFFEKARYYASNRGQDTVMQFTGFFDKAGTGIYEGDIVETGFDKYIIDFSARGFIGRAINHERMIIEAGVVAFEGTVVGNIFKNPELLENK